VTLMRTLPRQPTGPDLSGRRTIERSQPLQPSRADLVIDRALIGGLPNGLAKMNGKPTKVRKAVKAKAKN